MIASLGEVRGTKLPIAYGSYPNYNYGIVDLSDSESFSYAITSGGGADASTNALVINAQPEDYAVIKGIIEKLDLRRPIFLPTAAYGHFGRDEPGFSWEGTEVAETLKGAKV